MNNVTHRHWYAIHTYAGYEDAVERYLTQRIESLSMSDKIFRVVVPKEVFSKILDDVESLIDDVELALDAKVHN